MRWFGFVAGAIVAFLTMRVSVAAPPGQAAGATIEVAVLGSFHFDSPGLDLANVQVDDVLAPQRQAEIGEVLDRLERYAPTRILVEARKRVPGTAFSANYRRFLRGELPADRSEVVQIGFRLAQRLRHEEVFAVDVEGDFPFEPVTAWAEKAGRSGEVAAWIAAVQAQVAGISAQLKTQRIGQVLRSLNDPHSIRADHGRYLDLLRFGAGDEQPGARLVDGWYARNLAICARIVQAARPGDRLLVIYGAGHAYLLRHCLGGVPGMQLIDVNDILRAGRLAPPPRSQILAVGSGPQGMQVASFDSGRRDGLRTRVCRRLGGDARV